MVWTLVACLTLAAAAWAVVLFEILPRIDDWRDELSQQATRAIGVPVQIGRVSGEIEGAWPVLTLSEVRLLDDRGAVGLRLPQVTARLSPSSLLPWSVWQQEWRFDRLVLVAPELDVRRDASGRLHVAGLQVSSGASDAKASDKGLDWLFSQTRIQIQNGAVRWTDELRNAPTLALRGVDLSLRHHVGLGRRWHELDLEATPPAEFGQRATVKVSMTQPLWLVGRDAVADGAALPWWRAWFGSTPRPSQWATWSGDVKVQLPWVDVQQLRQHVTMPVEVNGGRGRVVGELAVFQGQPQALGLTLDVRDVSVRLASQLPLLAFKSLAGRVGVSHEADVSAAHYEGLRFETAEGLRWPASSASLEWRHAAWQGWPEMNSVLQLTTGGVFRAERLDLALLAQLADRLPLPVKVRQTLDGLAPQGVADDLEWRWEGLLDAPTSYKAKGHFAQLTWASDAESGLPGVGRAEVRFQADERGGRARLSIDQGWLDLPGVFEEPRLPLSTLDSELAWRISPGSDKAQGPDIDVFVKGAKFANVDAQGVLDATWQTGARSAGSAIPRWPGTLEMKGRLDRAQANRVWRYLPLVIPDSARYYVRDALKQGTAERVSFEVDGDLNQFPFPNDVGGRFRVNVPVRQVTLDYVPASPVANEPYWPAFSNLDGELVFAGQSMRITNAKARLGGLGSGGFALRDVSGEISDLASDDPHLTIKGQGEGPLDDALKYLATSPVGAWTGNMLGYAQGQGRAGLQLSLDIPLDRADDTKLKGRVILKDADQAGIRLAPALPIFTHVVGEIGFTESILTVKAKTQLWGQDVQVEGKRDATGAPLFEAHGIMTAEGLNQAVEWPIVAKLARRAQGSTPFKVTVSIPKVAGSSSSVGQPVVEVTSSLKGISTTLPAPLNKSADVAWPLRVAYRLDDAAGHTDALIVDVANPQMPEVADGAPWVKVDLRRDVTGAEAQLMRGIVSVAQMGPGVAAGMPVLPGRGLAIQMVVPQLDLDAWKSWGQSLQDSHESASSSLAAGLPSLITVKSPLVSYQQRTLHDVAATVAQPEQGIWRAQVDAKQIAGQIEWTAPSSPHASAAGRAGGRLLARLKRLSIPAADAQALEDQATEQLLQSDGRSSPVPALDVVIDEFDWRGLSLGKLEVEAINRAALSSGGTPEWKLTKFKLSSPEAQLSATGAWSAQQPSAVLQRLGMAPRAKPRSSFEFDLELTSLGDMLTRLGLPKTVKGGKGHVKGQVSWQGSPMEPDAATMSGDMAVAINEGQFLKVDPGMAKLLGVLSLQSLPRRLTLDFRDVFQQGFAFDAIDGQIAVRQGVAETRNLRMRGVQAVVLMEGQADLVKETQNLHVFVVPDVNAVGASLAYAAINPVVGLGTFVAQVLLRKQVSEAGTQEFMVTGSWADPQVEKLATRTAVPDAASSPSKPSLVGQLLGER